MPEMDANYWKLHKHPLKVDDASTNYCAICGLETLSPVHTVTTSDMNDRAKLLYEAAEIINGDRAQTYGDPEDSFGRIAALWNAMGFAVTSFTDEADGTRKLNVRPFDSVDVALALVQLKMSRIISSRDHEDSWKDAGGYIGLGWELIHRKIAARGPQENPFKPTVEFVYCYQTIPDSDAVKYYFRCRSCGQTVRDREAIDPHMRKMHPHISYVIDDSLHHEDEGTAVNE